MRYLNTTVLAGGVVYPAGTAQTDELAGLISNPDRWDGDGSPAPEPQPAAADGSDPDGDEKPKHPNAVVLREAVELMIELHLRDPETPIGTLLRAALEVYAPDDVDVDVDAAGAGDPDDQVPAIAASGDPGDADQLAQAEHTIAEHLPGDQGAASEAAGGAATTAHPVVTEPAPDYSTWSPADLRTAATDRGLEVRSNASKAALVAALTAADESAS